MRTTEFDYVPGNPMVIRLLTGSDIVWSTTHCLLLLPHTSEVEFEKELEQFQPERDDRGKDGSRDSFSDLNELLK